MFRAGEGALAHIIGKSLQGRGGQAVQIGIAFDEAGGATTLPAQQILTDQNLPITSHAGTNADGGNRHRLGNGARHPLRHRLNHQAERARRRQRLSIGQQLCRRRGVPPLIAIAADAVHRLRLKTNMTQNGDTTRGQKRHRLRHHLPPLQLNRRRPGFLQHPRRAVKGLRRAGLITAKGQIDHHQRLATGGGHAAPMGDHDVEGYRQGARLAIGHHRQRIAHQNQIGHLIHQPRHDLVIGGQADQRLRPPLRGQNIRNTIGFIHQSRRLFLRISANKRLFVFAHFRKRDGGFLPVTLTAVLGILPPITLHKQED